MQYDGRIILIEKESGYFGRSKLRKLHLPNSAIYSRSEADSFHPNEGTARELRMFNFKGLKGNKDKKRATKLELK